MAAGQRALAYICVILRFVFFAYKNLVSTLRTQYVFMQFGYFCYQTVLWKAETVENS